MVAQVLEAELERDKKGKVPSEPYPLTTVFHVLGCPKVSDLDVSVCVQQNVLRFQVSVSGHTVINDVHK